MTTKILFAGDIHGNEDHAEWLFKHASANGVTHIISCGDFGYWVHFRFGKKFINRVAHLAEQNNIRFYWVDGNHENHDILDDLVRKHGADSPIPTPNEWLRYIPRGCRFTIGDKTIMGYGGAYSVDWKQRVAGHTWWTQELINEYHLETIPAEKVDILVTHEAPLGLEISYKDQIPVSVRQRELVSEIVEKVQPDYHFCGHHHTRATWNVGDTLVNVLGRDTMEEDSVFILTLDSLETV